MTILIDAMVDLERFIDVLGALESVSDYAGIFGTIDLLLPRESDLRGFVASASSADIEVLSFRSVAPLAFVPYGGKGFTLAEAVLSLLGEAHERVLPFVKPRQADVYGSPSEVASADADVAGPDEIKLFAEEQYREGIPFRRFAESTRIGWLKAERLVCGMTDRKPALFPAQLAALGYIRGRREPPIGYPSSAGIALHVSWSKAVYKGLLEFVERDAINLGWHSRVPPYKLDLRLDRIESLLGVELSFSRDKLKFYSYLWRHDVDGAYTVSVHFIDVSRKLLVYHPGAAAGVSLAGAVAEAIQSYMFAYTVYSIRRAYGRDLDFYYIPEDADPLEADNLFKVVFYYGWPSNCARLHKEFFDHAKEAKARDAVAETEVSRWSRRWSLLKATVAERGIEPYVIDLTPPEIKDSHRLVKVFASELTQYNAPKHPYLGHPRYYNAPALLLVPDAAPRRYEDLRKVPVPYP